MTGRPLFGIVLAILAESAHWVKIRWDFDDEACARAWQFTTIAIAIAMVLIFLDGNPYMAMPVLLTWLPPLLLPMLFVQSYGLRDSIPANTFSFLAKYRRRRNERLGLTESALHVNFGNVYFVTTMVASTLGSRSSGSYEFLFLPGVIVLTGWMLLSASKSKPLSLLVGLTVAGLIALAGEQGLDRLQDYFGNSPGSSASGTDLRSNQTLIGRMGAVNQSPDIVWRLRPLENSKPPALLRVATYNSYEIGRWKFPSPPIEELPDLDEIEPTLGQVYKIVAPDLTPATQRKAADAGLPRFSLKGSASVDSPLALPGDAASLLGFELDKAVRNPLGSIAISPKFSVIEGTVHWKSEFDPESPPSPDDRRISRTETEESTLHDVVETLQLTQQTSLRDKLSTLQAWFQRDFKYTRQLTIGQDYREAIIPTALSRFLTTEKRGHCEYFATAATLLLRQAGVPARYATGYAVSERDPKRKEFVLRGTHRHAWCRVWDAGTKRWIDFDPTPASWTGIVAMQNTPMQRFYDGLKRTREDFFLWRNKPANRLAVTLVMSAIALGVVGFVARRLWKSKQRMETEKRTNDYSGPVARTPLNALERQAEKRLGARPPGQPFGEWLMRLRPALTDARPLEEAVELHQRQRFDPAPPTQSDRDRLQELAKQLQTAIKRG
jgi:transglutaminase-like putative cysteine protease